MNKIDINSMTEQDIENLADLFCSGCCRSCEECVRGFARDLWYYVKCYNEIHCNITGDNKWNFFKNGELQDTNIIKTLHDAIKSFKNGEIVETKDMLIDIINAITAFEDYY